MRPRWDGWRSPLGPWIEQFLTYKRALGRRYTSEAKSLRLFDAFVATGPINGLEEITAELIERFLVSRPRGRPRSYNVLLGALRVFFAWLVTQGALAESPVRARPRHVTSQRIPYLFAADQARKLLEVAAELPDRARAPLRGPTYRTIFALLYALGLRVGEVARLRRSDVDLDRQILLVRDTKFGKSRLVPFGPRVGRTLQEYLGLREQRSGGPLAADAPVFSFTRRGHVHPGTISQTFHQLVPRLGLTVPPGVATPRVHDLRHSFAVGTLLRWYRADLDPAGRLFHLSTFLGHVSPSSTAVYLTITTALLDEASERFARLAAPTITEPTP
jgi:site-specific recombinase XerD